MELVADGILLGLDLVDDGLLLEYEELLLQVDLGYLLVDAPQLLFRPPRVLRNLPPDGLLPVLLFLDLPLDSLDLRLQLLDGGLLGVNDRLLVAYQPGELLTIRRYC